MLHICNEFVVNEELSDELHGKNFDKAMEKNLINLLFPSLNLNFGLLIKEIRLLKF